MADVVELHYEREAQRLSVRLISPDAYVDSFVIWVDRYDERGERITHRPKFISSERRAVKWFNREAERLERAGWARGGEAGDIKTP